jgi:hypothetical protein
MKNKNLYIGLGVAALAVYFFVYRKKQGGATGTATKSADAPAVNVPSRNEELIRQIREARSLLPCGCGEGQNRCPNVRCARPTATMAAQNTSSSISPMADSETEKFAFNLTF